MQPAHGEGAPFHLKSSAPLSFFQRPLQDEVRTGTRPSSRTPASLTRHGSRTRRRYRLTASCHSAAAHASAPVTSSPRRRRWWPCTHRDALQVEARRWLRWQLFQVPYAVPVSGPAHRHRAYPLMPREDLFSPRNFIQSKEGRSSTD